MELVTGARSSTAQPAVSSSWWQGLGGGPVDRFLPTALTQRARPPPRVRLGRQLQPVSLILVEPEVVGGKAIKELIKDLQLGVEGTPAPGGYRGSRGLQRVRMVCHLPTGAPGALDRTTISTVDLVEGEGTLGVGAADTAVEQVAGQAPLASEVVEVVRMT